jgi:energy-coupling factor transporter ATP-binding protein EcfA2
MPDVQKDICNWLHQQQDWIQDAAEKLLSSGRPTEAEIPTIAERLKTPAGQVVTNHRTFDSLATAAAAAMELRLVEVGDISGIENLAPRSPLTFGTGNLVVIYGHTGSGKSGYTRILKCACGKPRATNLKPNVYQGPPATQQCRITYNLAGKDQSVVWQASDAPIDDIRTVDIFDADAATFYLSQEAEASYTPPSVALFEALAKTCDRVKTKLQEEQDLLVRALPAPPPEYVDTTVGIAYGALKPDIDGGAIQRLVKWDENDLRTLDQLAARLKTNDPASLAQKKRSTKGQLDQLAAQLRSASAAVGQEGLEIVRNARKEAQAKRRIATESARVGSAQLDGLGTATWNALWQAARVYSQTAYPGQGFPVTENGARCVLCHQELVQDAPQRLRDFEAFVQGAVEAAAKTAEDAHKKALERVPATLNGEDIRTRCQAAGLLEETWAKTLEEFWAKVGKAGKCLLCDEAEEQAVAVESPDDLLKELVQHSEALERDALQHDEDAKSFDRDGAEADKLNLEARRWTAQQASAIRTEIGRLEDVKSCEDWKRLANSYGISRKGGEIAKEVITKAYVDRFNLELKTLGALRIKVELIKTRMEKGKALHRLRLRGVQTGQGLPESILSEGERRIVALAACLADVAQKPQAAPFIFDDPISSLDLDFEWQVATRLARLAESRQVIVFTHRLSFYGAMDEAAKRIGEKWSEKHLYQNCIESFGGAAGHPADEQAWSANTRKANNILLDRLITAKKAGESDGAEAYRIPAQGICTEFRKLLERTVEDDLLSLVVRRHRRSVTTDGRIELLSKITHEDCEFIDGLMTKYSCYEHSQSREAPSFLPQEPELRADLESLKTWRDGFKKRLKEVSA